MHLLQELAAVKCYFLGIQILGRSLGCCIVQEYFDQDPTKGTYDRVNSMKKCVLLSYHFKLFFKESSRRKFLSKHTLSVAMLCKGLNSVCT